MVLSTARSLQLACRLAHRQPVRPLRSQPSSLWRPCRPRPTQHPPATAAAAFQGHAASPATLSVDTHTHYRLPEGWQQVLAVQVGVGCDLHGQSSTKAAERACRHAIEFVDLPCVHDIVPGRYEGVRLKVKVACPCPGMVDVTELKRVFHYGQLEIDVVEGGLSCQSANIVPELGESSDEMFVAVAAVMVGF